MLLKREKYSVGWLAVKSIVCLVTVLYCSSYCCCYTHHAITFMSKNTRTTERMEKMNGVNFMCVIRHGVCCFFLRFVFGVGRIVAEFRIIVKDNVLDCFYISFIFGLSLRNFFQTFFFSVIGQQCCVRHLKAPPLKFSLVLCLSHVYFPMDVRTGIPVVVAVAVVVTRFFSPDILCSRACLHSCCYMLSFYYNRNQ